MNKICIYETFEPCTEHVSASEFPAEIPEKIWKDFWKESCGKVVEALKFWYTDSRFKNRY